MGITGVVITIRAGRVQFREPTTVGAFPADVRVSPGETLYLLTNLGEGFSKAWFKGQLLTQIDASDFFTGVCNDRPDRCKGEIIEERSTDWWVQVRNAKGLVGWTLESYKFDGMDRFGDPR